MNPIVSVVIPIYNASSTIDRTLHSVISQTYKHLEIILVNDGSTDNSIEIIKEFVQKNAHYTFKIIDKPNGGVSSARNAGIDAATGHYIAFLDSDDKWLPEKTQRQMEILFNQPEIDSISCNMNGKVLKRLFGIRFTKLNRITSKMMMLKNFLCIQTTILKMDKVKKVGYFIENQINEDSNYMIRFSHQFNSYLLNEPYVIYRTGVESFGLTGLSSNVWKMQLGELANIKQAHKMNIINFPQRIFITLFSFAKYCRREIQFHYIVLKNKFVK